MSYCVDESAEDGVSKMQLQQTDAWRQERLGKATASRMADVCAKTRTGWGASRANYKAQLVAERLSGVSQETYTNAAMQWGTEHEPDARRAYEFFRDETVEEVGFVPHPQIAMSGASPDGLVGAHGLVEIKCPMPATHIETLLGRAMPSKYFLQVQFQLSCTGRQWCDFVSFDPRLPPSMQLFVDRIQRDEGQITALEVMVSEFLREVAKTVAALVDIYEQRAAA